MTILAQAADQLHRAYLVISLAVLACAAAIVSTFVWIWSSDPARNWPIFAIIAIAVTVCVASVAAWQVCALVMRQFTAPLAPHFHPLELLAEAACWALIATAGLCHFTAWYVIDILGQPYEQQVATFWRASNLSNGLSVLVPLVLLFTSFYVWCTWNTRRLKMQVYSRAEPLVFRDLLTGRDPAVKPEGGQKRGSFRRRLRWTMAEVTSWHHLGGGWWTLPVVLAVLLLALTPDRFTSVDGRAATWLLWWASVCGLVLGADALGRSAHQGFVLLEALRRLKSHPVSNAFGRVATKPFDWRLRLSPLRRLAIAPLIADMRILESRPRDPFRPIIITFPDLKDKGSVSDWDSATPIQATEQWPAVTRGVEQLYGLLAERQWTFAARAQERDTEKACTVLDAAEDVVAYCTAFILRNFLARVISGLTAGLTIFALVGFAHLLYPFQGRHLWLTTDLMAFVLAAVIACVTLLRFERDEILSKLWTTTPGRINWTGGFIYRIAITAAIPIFLVIASFFPEVSGSVASMIEPLRTALP